MPRCLHAASLANAAAAVLGCGASAASGPGHTAGAAGAHLAVVRRRPAARNQFLFVLKVLSGGRHCARGLL
eukprot:1138547-Pelagomonas_calceolata.AAC.13